MSKEWVRDSYAVSVRIGTKRRQAPKRVRSEIVVVDLLVSLATASMCRAGARVPQLGAVVALAAARADGATAAAHIWLFRQPGLGDSGKLS